MIYLVPYSSMQYCCCPLFPILPPAVSFRSALPCPILLNLAISFPYPFIYDPSYSVTSRFSIPIKFLSIPLLKSTSTTVGHLHFQPLRSKYLKDFLVIHGLPPCPHPFQLIHVPYCSVTSCLCPPAKIPSIPLLPSLSISVGHL